MPTLEPENSTHHKQVHCSRLYTSLMASSNLKSLLSMICILKTVGSLSSKTFTHCELFTSTPTEHNTWKRQFCIIWSLVEVLIITIVTMLIMTSVYIQSQTQADMPITGEVPKWWGDAAVNEAIMRIANVLHLIKGYWLWLQHRLWPQLQFEAAPGGG